MLVLVMLVMMFVMLGIEIELELLDEEELEALETVDGEDELDELLEDVLEE